MNKALRFPELDAWGKDGVDPQFPKKLNECYRSEFRERGITLEGSVDLGSETSSISSHQSSMCLLDQHATS